MWLVSKVLRLKKKEDPQPTDPYAIRVVECIKNDDNNDASQTLEKYVNYYRCEECEGVWGRQGSTFVQRIYDGIHFCDSPHYECGECGGLWYDMTPGETMKTDQDGLEWVFLGNYNFGDLCRDENDYGGGNEVDNHHEPTGSLGIIFAQQSPHAEISMVRQTPMTPENRVSENAATPNEWMEYLEKRLVEARTDQQKWLQTQLCQHHQGFLRLQNSVQELADWVVNIEEEQKNGRMKWGRNLMNWMLVSMTLHKTECPPMVD